MKKLLWFLFLILLALLSYYREVLFVSINAVIAGEQFFWAKTTQIDFFHNKSAATLVQYKYIMTVGFTLLFGLFTVIGLRVSFKERTPFLLVLLVYALCGFVAFVVLLYSFLTNSFNSVYSFLRLIIEYVHNPLVYIILSASFLGYSYSQKK
ncbi:hypothetical protein N9B55_01360 [Vicingaceae bacterium]|nr:hypothetical protein [Vicingaceae bacterium]MDB4060510.1 hypothetical protein [Vicingaceae bacterium]